MIQLLLFLLVPSTDACIPTSPAAVPPPPCQTCPALPEERFDPGVVTSVDANECVVRTYTCTVAPPPRVAVIGGDDTAGVPYYLVDPWLPTAQISVTCNAANTAWTFAHPTMGIMEIARIRCDFWASG